jgi:hypothetical protein
VHNGQITHLRDYVNVLAAGEAVGHTPQANQPRRQEDPPES